MDEDWAAIYLPKLSKEQKDPSIFSGFKTEEAAWEYIFSGMCFYCKESRRKSLAGVPDGFHVDDEGHEDYISLYPCCTTEWNVVPSYVRS